MTSYGYARVSTLEQNPKLQIDELIASGIDPQNIYVDHASGTREDRPGLAQALAAVGDGDCLTVWRLDRLGRSTSHLIRTVEALGSRGAAFKSLRDPVDTTTPSGKLVFSIFAAIAQFERQLIAERTAAGLVAAKAKGTLLGRRTKVRPQQHELIMDMVARGSTQETIAASTGLSRSVVGRVIRGEIRSLLSVPVPNPDALPLH